MARTRLAYYYTPEQEEAFLKVIPRGPRANLFIILFGTGARICEIVGETRRTCITCSNLRRKKIDPNSNSRKTFALCALTKEPLPKSPKIYTCDQHKMLHPPLRIEQINLERRELRIIGKGDKERMVIVMPEAIEAFKRQIGKRITGPIDFGVGIRRTEQLAKYYAKQAGLPEVDKYGRWSPHKIRHTHLTQMVDTARQMSGEIDSLAMAKEQAGHERIETTMGYLHLSSDSDPRRKITEKMGMTAKTRK